MAQPRILQRLPIESGAHGREWRREWIGKYRLMKRILNGDQWFRRRSSRGAVAPLPSYPCKIVSKTRPLFSSPLLRRSKMRKSIPAELVARILAQLRASVSEKSWSEAPVRERVPEKYIDPRIHSCVFPDEVRRSVNRVYRTMLLFLLFPTR